ncbi:PREDICTED: uncharacterized protein LOC104826457 [Tarenaya hassleriana]|uniref:uncharacterized protein LOC104826457 n=1 Tax=Tarenaya hassleriana TaxID=28532 RepID=UPI00053C9BE1|nr:PREDICTED: uncharacterized protein LOC104826457 [Tarenaya hassleriana]
METACAPSSPLQTYLMYSLSSKLRPSLSLRLSAVFSTQPPSATVAPRRRRMLSPTAALPRRSRVKAVDAALLKKNWLDSLSLPSTDLSSVCLGSDNDPTGEQSSSNWVIGVDPDSSGALALLRTDETGCSAQVFDTPHLSVLVGKQVRKRPDARSIVQLIRGLDVPPGTTAYMEQSTPFPKDGKLGWYSGGFGYGLWLGILVASGFPVIPISSSLWKNQFQLAGGSSTKDDSRRVASELFPLLSPQLSRKKDHGRAEALLIAAYGIGLKTMRLKTEDVIAV